MIATILLHNTRQSLNNCQERDPMRSLLQGILFASLLAVSSSSLEPVSANDEVIELLNDCQGTSTFSGEGTLVATKSAMGGCPSASSGCT